MVLHGYTQLNPDTKESSSTPPASAPPQYTTIYPGFGGTGTTFPGTPQPLYPNLPQQVYGQTSQSTPIPGLQQFNGHLFNPFGQVGNPFAQPTAPVITGQPAVTEPSEVIGNSTAAGSGAAQVVNYSITYYAPHDIENSHTECINCCEDCCEDCCENWCLNCCLDCSKLTNALFGGNTAAATATTGSTTATTPGYTLLGSTDTTTPGFTNVDLGAHSLVWDSGSTGITGSTGTTFTLGNALGSTLKK